MGEKGEKMYFFVVLNKPQISRRQNYVKNDNQKAEQQSATSSVVFCCSS